MARPQNKLNDAKSEVIEENFLKQNPEGFADDANRIVIANVIPEMRYVQFLNGRDPGHELMFHYHSKTHPLKHYTLFHGKEYNLPVEIIEHLENCAERVYGYKQNEEGHPQMYVKSLKYIFQCKSVKKAA